MTEIMLAFFQFINSFVYVYPLIMSFVWIIGGLVFYWRLERRFYEAPTLEAYPFFLKFLQNSARLTHHPEIQSNSEILVLSASSEIFSSCL